MEIPVVTQDITDKTDPYVQLNELPHAYAKVVIAIIVVIMVLSFVGNALALCSLSRHKNNVYPWFFNLALTDLVKTLLCMPYSIYLTQSQWFENTEGFVNRDVHCQFFGYIFYLVFFMGLISVMCVALDRVHATYFPFHYSINHKKCPAQYVVLVTWGAVAVLAGLPFYLQHGKNAKSPFGLHALQPMCIFDVWDTEAFKGKTMKEVDVYVVLYYTILYAVAVVVIVTSTGLAMHKLLPRLIAERKLHQNARKTVVFCNSAEHGDEPGMTTVGLENMVTTLSTSGDQLGGTRTPTSTPIADRKVSKFSLDNLTKLHIPSTKQTDKRQNKRRNQWRAIQTMMIVSVAFVACHVTHIMYWVLYEDVIKETDKEAGSFKIPQSKYIALACVKTGQIITVYLNSAVNVIVYYSRCALIKESMKDHARTFIKVLMTPLYILIRSRRS